MGGAKRDRTADLLHAMQALSQLSYGPKSVGAQRADRPTAFRLRARPDRNIRDVRRDRQGSSSLAGPPMMLVTSPPSSSSSWRKVSSSSPVGVSLVSDFASRALA